MTGVRRLASFASCWGLALVLAATPAAAQMPDLSQMNGRSLPAPDAPVGSATVRVMRQTLGNNVVGQEVTLTDAAGAAIGTRATDDGGRATFDGLRPGTDVHGRRNRLGRAADLAAVHAAGVGRCPRRARSPVSAPPASRRAAAPSPRQAGAGRQHHARHAVADDRRAGRRVRRGLRPRRSGEHHRRPGLAAGAHRLHAAGRRTGHRGPRRRDQRRARRRPDRREGAAPVRPDLGAVRLPAAERHRPRRHRPGLSGRRADEQRHRAAARHDQRRGRRRAPAPRHAARRPRLRRGVDRRRSGRRRRSR